MSAFTTEATEATEHTQSLKTHSQLHKLTTANYRPLTHINN